MAKNAFWVCPNPECELVTLVEPGENHPLLCKCGSMLVLSTLTEIVFDAKGEEQEGGDE